MAIFFSLNENEKSNSEYNFFKYCITKKCKLKILKNIWSKFNKK